MLKNPNQKVIKRMAGNALKVNRRKTITLFLAVLLSSFLVFTIFTVGDSYFRLQKIQNIRMSGAEFDAIMYGVTDEQRQMCENNPDIVLTGTAGGCGWEWEKEIWRGFSYGKALLLVLYLLLVDYYVVFCFLKLLNYVWHICLVETLVFHFL